MGCRATDIVLVRHAERSEASHPQRANGMRGMRFLAALGMTRFVRLFYNKIGGAQA